MKRLALLLAGLAALAIGGSASASSPNSAHAHLKHVFVIMLENHSQPSVIGDPNAPFITSLAANYGEADNYYGVTHPSEPNYVAAISGSNWGVNDDQPTNTYPHWNLVDELEAHKQTWAAYMESMPSAGFTGQQYPSNAALYVYSNNVAWFSYGSNQYRLLPIANSGNAPTRLQAQGLSVVFDASTNMLSCGNCNPSINVQLKGSMRDI